MSPKTATTGLVDALGLGAVPELIALVGGGGKSSLLFALGESLPGRIVLTTTTRIFAAQMSLAADACNTDDDDDLQARLADFDKSLLVVGRVEGERAVGVTRDLPATWLARPDVDGVVVEADGSRMRPVKAPADHEPVIPDRTSLLVCVVGIDALDAPIERAAHRPERVANIAGMAAAEPLTPEALGKLLASPRGGLKDVPDTARIAVLINKVESGAQRDAARRVADRVLREERIERVLMGALQGDLDANWEVRSR